jgi:hypothetical protein
VAPLGVL